MFNSSPVGTMVGALFFIMFGAPMLFMMFGPLAMMGAVGSIFDRDRFRINDVLSAEDIAFGGDAKKLLATYKRLRGLSANPGDARISNKSLSVAIVTVGRDRLQDRTAANLGVTGGSAKTTRAIDVNLKEAGEGAVLLMADRPVMWQATGVRSSHRAKIAVEGNAVFDIANTQQGLLAGFRVGSYGARDTADPRDLDDDATKKGRYRFCYSMRVWAEQFNVEMGDIRIYRFADPTRIAVVGDRLSDASGRRITPEYVSDACRTPEGYAMRSYWR